MANKENFIETELVIKECEKTTAEVVDDLKIKENKPIKDLLQNKKDQQKE